jgi:hypothetical protein
MPRLPAKIFPLPFGDLHLDPNTIGQSFRVWISSGRANSFEDALHCLAQADPVLRCAAYNRHVEHWLETLYEQARST